MTVYLNSTLQEVVKMIMFIHTDNSKSLLRCLNFWILLALQDARLCFALRD